MKWSFSTSRMFLRCPRKWYYYAMAASPRAKNPMRREAHLLRQLQTLYAWRGSLVDTVIEKLIVPGIRSRNLPSEDDVISFSMELAEKQLKFGKERKHRSINQTKSSVGEAYCAFYDVEYNDGINEEEVQVAKQDIIISLGNLLHSKLIKEIVEKYSYVTAQRTLVFRFADSTISCTPDLLVFSPNFAPLIVDWKVHAFASTDYLLQLGVYAVALSRTNPHKDFPKNIESQLKDPTTFRLIEYQLLKNEQREYSISSNDIVDVEDYIFLSCTQMNNLLDGRKFRELNIEQFPTARFPETCSKCGFGRLCCKKMPIQRSLFEVPWA